MAELALSAEAVLGFLRERGGRVRNAELVSAFRPLLEPAGAGAGEAAEGRAERRERFKAAVNAVATVKEIDGTKFVVLRRELRAAPTAGGAGAPGGDAGPAPVPLPAPGPVPGPAGTPPEEPPGPRAVWELRGLFQGGGGGVPLPGGAGGARREPPPKPCMLPVRCVPVPAPAPTGEPPAAPSEPPAALSPPSLEDEAGSRSPGLRRGPKAHRGSEETVVPLEQAEHQWLVLAAGGQWTQQLHGLLLGDASLAARRDFVSGFTALHWAAKSGNCDMVTNIIRAAEKGGARVNVDARAHGGYTALHLAAIHGREKIINMLVYSYHANTDLRDYSGKKAHQYLREGTSLAIRRLLGDPSLSQNTEHSVPIKKSTKLAASILSSTSTFLGVISDDMAFYDLTKGLRKPSTLNKLLAATTGPRRKPKTRGGFPSYSSLSEVMEEEEEVIVKRRPVSELFFGH
ncbi:LOW QUALITY PROTEIN: ankyrin repeat domain-containing protein SOWAHA [Neopelma chrysocephalum]|uniref:LOW QUALITY PROTEIN: ankyrin repeat domain-containing protein SOWAHA n=1 Tax=Neopelma chrysocephalum TaxID=114329 RepID=UPI000FCD2F14|nr:LOW QUALITY PROTEIN: ankyrin repeat domain-containing protein SOWAHA [Neopelma chrysocephalum]